MTDIELVIKIPEEVYNGIISSGNFISNFNLSNAFANGTVLPKGHGRLCDLDAALKCMEEVADDKSSIKECAMGFFDWACSKRVILKADKEVENEFKRPD